MNPYVTPLYTLNDSLSKINPDQLPPVDHLETLISIALEEDIGTADITTQSTIPSGKQANAILKAKQSGILCGSFIFEYIFHKVDSAITMEWFAQEGDALTPGFEAAHIRGSAASLLTAERTALNFIQRMSGIATLTNQWVQTIKNQKIQLLDTRKTLPGYRILDKYAVRMGGGMNHRFGLYDMILIKENHIRMAGGIAQAISWARNNHPSMLIEIETTSLEEVKHACQAQASIIMLDNMNDEELTKCIKWIHSYTHNSKANSMIVSEVPEERAQKVANPPIKIEVSGNITGERLTYLAELGVDYVSMGSLTHSVPAFDFSLLIQLTPQSCSNV